MHARSSTACPGAPINVTNSQLSSAAGRAHFVVYRYMRAGDCSAHIQRLFVSCIDTGVTLATVD